MIRVCPLFYCVVLVTRVICRLSNDLMRIKKVSREMKAGR